MNNKKESKTPLTNYLRGVDPLKQDVFWTNTARATYLCIEKKGENIHLIPVKDEFNYTGIQPQGLLYIKAEDPTLSFFEVGRVVNVTFKIDAV